VAAQSWRDRRSCFWGRCRRAELAAGGGFGGVALLAQSVKLQKGWRCRRGRRFTEMPGRNAGARNWRGGTKLAHWSKLLLGWRAGPGGEMPSAGGRDTKLAHCPKLP
jgi:hypothetical protein